MRMRPEETRTGHGSGRKGAKTDKDHPTHVARVTNPSVSQRTDKLRQNVKVSTVAPSPRSLRTSRYDIAMQVAHGGARPPYPAASRQWTSATDLSRSAGLGGTELQLNDTAWPPRRWSPGGAVEGTASPFARAIAVLLARRSRLTAPPGLTRRTCASAT